MQKITTKELHPEYRPDEKFLNYGPGALSDAELLAIIIRTGSRDFHSVDLARSVLSCGGEQSASLLNIFRYNYHELMRIRGIGRVKALQIKAIAEISRRIAQGQAKPHLVFDHPDKVAEYYMEQLRHRKKETVVLLMLDTSCKLIREKTISTGTVNISLVSPREIFIEALRYEAVQIILLHNHPSGNPTPSLSDSQMTKAIQSLGKMIGICLLDHIIIGDNRYYSYKESGLLDE